MMSAIKDKSSLTEEKKKKEDTASLKIFPWMIVFDGSLLVDS